MLLPSPLPLSWTFFQPLLLLFLCFWHHCILSPKQNVKSMPICMEITLSNILYLPKKKSICLSQTNVCMPDTRCRPALLRAATGKAVVMRCIFPTAVYCRISDKTGIFRSAKGSQLLITDISDTSKIKELVKRHFLCAFRLFLVTRGTSLMMLIIIYWTATTCSVTYKTEHELTTSTRWVMQIRGITANAINI